MFRDPFNYGLLVQANQNVDLRQIQPGFVTVTDEATFNQVQALGYSRTKDAAPKKRTAFYPLRGMVYCAACESTNHMQVGKNKTGSGTYVLTYRCDNPACTRKPKSLRAKHVFNSIYERLDKLELTNEAYERYSKRLDTMTEPRLLLSRNRYKACMVRCRMSKTS